MTADPRPRILAATVIILREAATVGGEGAGVGTEAADSRIAAAGLNLETARVNTEAARTNAETARTNTEAARTNTEAARANAPVAGANAEAAGARAEAASNPAASHAAPGAAVGLEVLMQRRHDRGSFAGAWVFPGGQAEPEDGPTAGDLDTARRTAAREVREETALRLDATALLPLALWTPPRFAPRYFRTWFFVAPSFAGVPVNDERESAALEWVSPTRMLTNHAAGAATLLPPTWVTLHWLAQFDTVEAVTGALAGHTPEHYATEERDGVFYWHGDVLAGDTGRHRLITTALPWRYERDIT